MNGMDAPVNHGDRTSSTVEVQRPEHRRGDACGAFGRGGSGSTLGGGDLPPYADYKDSGVEWLGKVPAHWEVMRLRRLGRLFKGGGGTKEDEREDGIPCVRYGDLYTHHRFFITASRACVTPELAATTYTPIRYGDVLFAGSGETIDEIGKSAVNLIPGPACCGGDVIIFRPSIDADARFLGYVTDCSPSARQKARIGRGFTVMHIYSSDLKYMTVAIPPLPEQAAIVRFLDHADRRIRRYIRARKKLITLLEERKKAIIHEAVTGKLDVRTGRPYPAYKDSGVEWLGEVPAHWQAAQLRRMAVDRCDGPFGSGLKSAHYTERGIRVVRLQNIGHGEFRDSDAAFISQSHYASLGDHSVLPGDILVAGLGDDSHPPGRACVAPENIVPAMVKADCFRFRPDMEQVEPQFMAHQLTATAVAASAVLSTGATRSRTNLQSASARVVGIPNVREQRLIVAFISLATSSICVAQQAAKQQVAAFGEYRTRLIADVVTGKLDVRDAAKRMPAIDPLGRDGDWTGDEQAVGVMRFDGEVTATGPRAGI